MNPSPPPVRRAGFTLVELLVAATIALVVMAALTSLFGIFGRAVSDSQELLRLAARMRSTAWRLRQDLQGATAEARPLIRPEAAAGYLEIIEGPAPGSDTGDTDDILMLTTASPGRPFTGLIATTTPTTTSVTTVGLESDVAEVAWFCKQGRRTDDGVQLFNLYRRQLLVSAAPGVGMMATTNTTAILSGTTRPQPWAWDLYFRFNDLSVRREGDVLIANSLADLSRRHARFMHNVLGVTSASYLAASAPSGNVPHTLPFSWPQITTTSTVPGASDILTGSREGEDLILADVTSFDIRVFDPQQLTAVDSYVDLGNGPAATQLSAAANVTLSGFGSPVRLATNSSYSLSVASSSSIIRVIPGVGDNNSRFFDTWSLHTEWNSVPDNTTANVVDRGTNLVDDNGNGVVDDVGELEQPPPYNVPLRGVEIRIRCYEPSSKEVRQVTIQHSFRSR